MLLLCSATSDNLRSPHFQDHFNTRTTADVALLFSGPTLGYTFRENLWNTRSRCLIATADRLRSKNQSSRLHGSRRAGQLWTFPSTPDLSIFLEITSNVDISKYKHQTRLCFGLTAALYLGLRWCNWNCATPGLPTSPCSGPFRALSKSPCETKSTLNGCSLPFNVKAPRQAKKNAG